MHNSSNDTNYYCKSTVTMPVVWTGSAMQDAQTILYHTDLKVYLSEKDEFQNFQKLSSISYLDRLINFTTFKRILI